MKLTLCNEVIRELSFVDQCRLAAALGFNGLEVAPFTLSETPAEISKEKRKELRQIAISEGIVITGLHWLMNVPDGLSITSDNPAIAARTRKHMLDMVELCHDLGGSILVHGSPANRKLTDASDENIAKETAFAHFQSVGKAAEAAGVVYCIEALSPSATNFITHVAEAIEIVKRANSPGLATMLDTNAAWNGETEAPEKVLARYLPSGHIRHIHFNDTNKRGPGQGGHGFAAIVNTLVACEYNGLIGIEPFDYHPDGPTSAARAIGYVRGLMENAQCH